MRGAGRGEAGSRNELSGDLAGIERVDEQVQQARDIMEQIMADAKSQLVAKL
jgi:hypothetical protein